MSLVHRGIVPASVGRRRSGGAPGRRRADRARRDRSLLGPRAEVHRQRAGVAERTVDTVAKRLGARSGRRGPPNACCRAPASPTTKRWRSRLAAKFSSTCRSRRLRHLTARYAEAAAVIVRMMKERPDWMEPVAAGCPTTGVEVVHAVRHEMAVRLTDIVIRRTGLGAAGHPGARGRGRLRGNRRRRSSAGTRTDRRRRSGTSMRSTRSRPSSAARAVAEPATFGLICRETPKSARRSSRSSGRVTSGRG